MRSSLDDPAVLDHKHLIDRFEPGQPMRDQNRGTTLCHVQKVVRQCTRRREVEVFGRFVQDENWELRQECPRHGHPLPLTTGESGTVLSDLGGQPLGKLVEPVAEAHSLERGTQLGIGCRTVPDAQVLRQ